MAMYIDVLGESAKPQLGSLVTQGYSSVEFTDAWIIRNIDNVYSVQADCDELEIIIRHFANLVYPKHAQVVTFYGDAAKMIVAHWNSCVSHDKKAAREKKKKNC